MAKKKVLLAGESWVSAATHYKGHDQFASVTFHLGAEPLVAALKDSPFELDYMPGHDGLKSFPQPLMHSTGMTLCCYQTSVPTQCCCTPTSGCAHELSQIESSSSENGSRRVEAWQ